MKIWFFAKTIRQNYCTKQRCKRASRIFQVRSRSAPFYLCIFAGLLVQASNILPECLPNDKIRHQKDIFRMYIKLLCPKFQFLKILFFRLLFLKSVKFFQKNCPFHEWRFRTEFVKIHRYIFLTLFIFFNTFHKIK